MEIRTGAIPLTTLAIIFAVLQVWWIRATIRTGGRSKYSHNNQISNKEFQRDQLQEQKEKLEILLKK